MRLDSALFEIRARLKSASELDAVRQQILETVDGLRQRPVDEDKLTAAKKHLRYSLAATLNNSESIAAVLADFIALRRTPETIDRFYSQLAQLKPEDIQKTAAKYLTEDGRTIVTLTGPEGSK
jgi:zinc protease